jgi:hypothetical protein
LNDATLDKVVRNAASSWTQSGISMVAAGKSGRMIQPTSVIGGFCAGAGLHARVAWARFFESLFSRVLDRDENALTFLAMDAKRLGLLDIKSGGGMTVVSFDAILTEKEKRLIHGTH